jgi:hypothetical protein
MDRLTEFFRHPNILSVSVQLLIMYCVSVGLFFSVSSVERTLSAPLKASVDGGKPLSLAALFALASVSNAVAVWAMVYLCGRLDVVPRLAMVGLPLALLAEEHVRAGRTHPETRRRESILAVGMAVGIAAAAFALMRGAPLK